MMDAVIDEIDGRLIRVGDKWLADFASCNYLGFDLDREIIDAIPAYLDEWGTHPSWSRLLGSPVLYEEIEEQLTELLGLRGLARPADDHAHPHVRDPAARRLGHDLPRRARAQDDLRRLPGRAGTRRGGPALPLRGSGPPRLAAARGARSDPPGLHGRRQQHDRQPAGPARFRRGRAPPRRAALRRRRPRLRRDRRARGRRAVPLRRQGQQHRPPRRRDLRQPGPRRRLLEGVLVAAGVHRLPDRRQEPAQGRGAAVPVLRARRRSRRSQRCLPGFEVNGERGDAAAR